jgi:hypothetical protein
MTRVVELPLPKVPGSNSRSHWTARSRAARVDRLAARLVGYSLPRTTMPAAHVTIDWYCSTRRMIDTDNALSRCKSYLDGLTDAGWWIDVHPPTSAIKGRVRISAEPIEVQQPRTSRGC